MVQISNISAPMQNNTTSAHKNLTMVKNDRMGGYVPQWSVFKTQHQNIEHKLSMTENSFDSSQNLKNDLNYNIINSNAKSEEFGFGDLVDILNPLHHIPVASTLYRDITDDTIKPISQVVGGALFGGVLGAASSLVNVVVEQETGKNIGENAIAFVVGDKKPELPTSLLAFTKIDTQTDKVQSRAEMFNHYKKLHRARMYT